MMREDITAKRIKAAREDALYDKLISQLQLNPTGVIVIDPNAKPDSEEAKAQALIWDRWQIYLGRIGRRNTLKVWKGILAGGSKLTLPCADPDEMDPPIFRTGGREDRYWDR